MFAVGSKQLKAYTANQADISRRRPLPEGLLSPTSSGKAHHLVHRDVLGVAEQPDPADADGKGTAILAARREGEGQVCYSLSVSNIGGRSGERTSTRAPPTRAVRCTYR